MSFKTTKAIADVRALLLANPAARCRVCGLPLVRCRELLRLPVPAELATPATPEGAPAAPPTAPDAGRAALFTESLFG